MPQTHKVARIKHAYFAMPEIAARRAGCLAAKPPRLMRNRRTSPAPQLAPPTEARSAGPICPCTALQRAYRARVLVLEIDFVTRPHDPHVCMFQLSPRKSSRRTSLRNLHCVLVANHIVI